MILIRGLGLTVPSYKDLIEVETELINRANEIQHSCMLLLTPLLEGIDFGHKYLDHWAIPMSDIKNGYCELEEIVQYKEGKPLLFGRKFILLLYDYEDESLGRFYGGELIELSKAIHFIDNIPQKKDKIRGLYDAIISSIQLASRYKISNKLFKDE
jgi:hypothetical protein